MSFTLFLIHEFRSSHPLVNLRALKNRNLAIGCGLVFALGVVLYGLTSELPIFYQTLLGYSATASGFAVSPRGLGSVAASLIVGWLVSRMDPRWIVSSGYVALGLSGLWLSFLTLDISPTTLFWPITISGVALAMIFVPLSKVALGTLSESETGNASGIFNFLRNVGGSIGISVANTVAQRHLQSHRNDLVHSYSGASWLLRRQLQLLIAQLSAHAGPGARNTLLRAYLITSNTLNNQAQLYAYVDVFQYFAIICAVCVPFAFLFKKPKPGKRKAA